MPNNTAALAADLIWGAEYMARKLGISRAAVYHLLAAKRLPATKLGRRWVASRSQLRAALVGAPEATE